MKKFIVAIMASFSFAAVQAASTITMPFSLPWMNATTANATYNSSDHPDGIFVIENYFDACPYCNANATNVNALATQFASQPRVQILDVGVDTDASDYQDWITNNSPNHPVLDDGSMTVTNQLGTTGYPSTYVIDCKGNVAYSHVGEWQSGDSDTFAQQINTLLGQTCSNSQR